jgi:hypothetical protein
MVFLSFQIFIFVTNNLIGVTLSFAQNESYQNKENLLLCATYR